MKKKNRNLLFISMIGVLLLLLSLLWGTRNFQIKSFNQVIYTLTSPMGGASDGVALTWIVSVALPTLLISIVTFLYISHKDTKLSRKISKNLHKIIFATSIVTVILALIIYQIPTYAMNKVRVSDLYEEFYIDPSTQDFVFPEKKKNLIYIYLESMETTFTTSSSVELVDHEISGNGFQSLDAIPELTSLAIHNVNFSNSTGLGGAFLASDTGWTTAAMLAQSAGVSLNPTLSNDAPDIAPGAYSLGEILDKEGYNQILMFGSEAEFGGRGAYFKNHGNYDVFDFNTAKEKSYIPEDYHTWWGFEDSKLFDFAKRELEELSNKDAPFNLTLLTANTHNPDGYIDNGCEVSDDNQYLSSLSCSSKQVYDFIAWVQEQEWASDTVIVLTGDHLSMNTSYMDKVDQSGYDRRIYNTFINSVPSVTSTTTTNREFTSLDMFPTTLSALGVEWSGNALGLGVDLFSGDKTIPEILGPEVFNVELAKRSNYYDENISTR